ncbi:MAG: hypothetical protein A4E48_00241 [Methanosaeta sp. PtaU1.Bin060]|nr:MAG: hypothetical protein A4E48_00241 [Methanosaeta sp. PtaU1.Bin060]
MNWSKSLKWLQDHPGAEPGGDPDLFDMPLPPEIKVDGQEWTGSPEWGEQDDGIIGTCWRIGNSGFQVVVTDRESYIRDPEGFRV